MAAPKKYPDELKARAVRLYRESDPKPTVRNRLRALGGRAGTAPLALRRRTASVRRYDRYLGDKATGSTALKVRAFQAQDAITHPWPVDESAARSNALVAVDAQRAELI
ncbi:hypothetical protein [Nocardia australiensis]|uniref:hypothetical protein n=1 Tax=Nocardia australiensis TaxID=2887191 RepID=UPI001D156AC9|nr:hypothetical protein [Nocardia australiensis]